MGERQGCSPKTPFGVTSLLNTSRHCPLGAPPDLFATLQHYALLTTDCLSLCRPSILNRFAREMSLAQRATIWFHTSSTPQADCDKYDRVDFGRVLGTLLEWQTQHEQSALRFAEVEQAAAKVALGRRLSHANVTPTSIPYLIRSNRSHSSPS